MSDFLSTDTDLLPAYPGQLPSRRSEMAKRKRMLRDLDAAMLAGMLSLHLRPRSSIQTGMMIAQEANWRWGHRRYGLQSGSVLAELAGKGATGQRLAVHMLADAARKAAQLNLPVSLRIWQGSLPLINLEAQIAEALARSGARPGLLEMRFAEPQLAAMSNEDVLRLSALRDAGLGIALEHFGSGATSLGLLRRLPLTTVTLSAELLHQVPHDADDCAVLSAIAAAARGLGLSTVACGVQRQEQLDFLAGIGCDAAQGPLFTYDLSA